MENENRPHVKPGPIKYTKGYGRRVFFSKLISASIVVMAIIAIGLTFVVYINQPVKTPTGYTQSTLIRRRAPVIGEKVVIVETENYHMFTPLKRALVNQEVYEAEIVAGPYGEIKESTDGYLVVYADQTVAVDLDININEKDEKYLDNEYVVRKVGVSQDKVVKKDEILGLIANHEKKE